MDIHKPKPFHSWREFFKEYGIIVLGVMTALAGEQVVEALRWRSEVAEARESIDKQAAKQLFAASERIDSEKCEHRQLDRLAEIVSQNGRTPQVWRSATVPFRSWNTSSWTAATASGAVAHMPPDLRGVYAAHFNLVEVIRALNLQEFVLASDLDSLRAPTVLSDTARDRLASDIARMQGLNQMQALGARQMVDHLHGIGVEMSADEQAALKKEAAEPCLMPDEAETPKLR